jgi:hypothetical protein
LYPRSTISEGARRDFWRDCVSGNDHGPLSPGRGSLPPWRDWWRDYAPVGAKLTSSLMGSNCQYYPIELTALSIRTSIRTSGLSSLRIRLVKSIYQVSVGAYTKPGRPEVYRPTPYRGCLVCNRPLCGYTSTLKGYGTLWDIQPGRPRPAAPVGAPRWCDKPGESWKRAKRGAGKGTQVKIIHPVSADTYSGPSRGPNNKVHIKSQNFYF